ncbi:N-acetylmuramoyl-L-alanine amidase [Halobacillus shinanisalinarum]|uniref:N-acetylmuramoyl-L-alanine amidase n=1 Tax=Halobacillus shinanisalinarum TaxID=2932258 RepID=A0ABY4GZQ6_9BACI|nr:N-acetylmuramoyl-L-alanine amidase [Halobacillus shinanisalinarum]UOQ93426.1 N-acetylmuramoyl-L-alanine amidase [Halobacillus shinanisalinarum]
MAYLIALDDGHGENTPGKRTPYISSLGRAIHENEFNKPMINFLNEELKRCGFDTLLVAPGDTDHSLTSRTNRANKAGADAYISGHFNAFDGSFEGSNPSGISLFVYPGHLNRDAGELAGCIAKYLRQGTHQNYRGIKEANFHVLRETHMIAVLTENGFMDHPDEAFLMLDRDFQREVAIEHAKGICDYFNVRYVADDPAPTYSMDADERLGEVVIGDKPMNYRERPSLDAPVIRELPAGHGKNGEPYTVHLYEVKGHWLRLGQGWISNAEGAYATVKMYDKNPNGSVYRVIINGKQVGAYADDDNIADQVRKAVESGKDNVKIERV